MRGWGEQVQTYLLDGQKVCRIVVAEAKGSTPREAGADMYVTAHQTSGTIGGGTPEFEAMALARQILAEIPENSIGFTRHFRVFALGPNLGQCCGGQVTLLFEGFAPAVWRCWPLPTALLLLALFIKLSGSFRLLIYVFQPRIRCAPLPMIKTAKHCICP